MILGLNAEEAEAYREMLDAGFHPLTIFIHLATAAVDFDVIELEDEQEVVPDPDALEEPEALVQPVQPPDCLNAKHEVSEVV